MTGTTSKSGTTINNKNANKSNSSKTTIIVSTNKSSKRYLLDQHLYCRSSSTFFAFSVYYTRSWWCFFFLLPRIRDVSLLSVSPHFFVVSREIVRFSFFLSFDLVVSRLGDPLIRGKIRPWLSKKTCTHRRRKTWRCEFLMGRKSSEWVWINM